MSSIRHAPDVLPPARPAPVLHDQYPDIPSELLSAQTMILPAAMAMHGLVKSAMGQINDHIAFLSTPITGA